MSTKPTHAKRERTSTKIGKLPTGRLMDKILWDIVFTKKICFEVSTEYNRIFIFTKIKMIMTDGSIIT